MGNSGSVHNCNINGVRSELNSNYQPESQQKLELRRNSKKKIYLQKLPATATARRQRHLPDISVTDWTHSLPHMSFTSSSVDSDAFHIEVPSQAQTAQFKVLPKLSENMKLRTTTNGTILLSGGTISGRKEPKYGDCDKQPVAMAPQQLPQAMTMQRARTFIYESSADSKYIKQTSPLFKRAKTLVNLNYSAANSAGGPHKYASTPEFQLDKVSKKFPAIDGTSKVADTVLTPCIVSIKSIKINKYNKKRKAPLAPTAAGSIATATENSKLIGHAPKEFNTHSTAESKSAEKTVATTSITLGISPAEQQGKSLTRPRLFRTNIKSTYTQLQQQQQDSRQQTSLQRNSLSRSKRCNETHLKAAASVKTLTLDADKSQQRKKTSEAMLNKTQDQQKTNPGTVKIESCHQDNQQAKKSEKKLFFIRPSVLDGQEISNSKASKHATKIPQLKRTFYFGMNSRSDTLNASTGAVVDQLQGSHLNQESIECQAIAMPAVVESSFNDNHLLLSESTHCRKEAFAVGDDATNNAGETCAEDIDDNGLLVHVRPTLPRRQLETPSFSPAAAWLRLVEEQKYLLYKRKIKAHISILNENENAMDMKSRKANVATRIKKKLIPTEVVIGDYNNSRGDSEISADEFTLNSHTTSSVVKEVPIQLHSTLQSSNRFPEHKATDAITPAIMIPDTHEKTNVIAWTPQQDLDDDDDEDKETEENAFNLDYDVCGSEEYRRKYGMQNVLTNHKSNKCKITPIQFSGAMSAVHMFSLSLPRDALIQTHIKNDSNSHIDKVTAFSSLQKLKSTIFDKEMILPNEYVHHRSNGSLNEMKRSESDELKATTTHCSTNYRSDNWVLHKTRDASSGFCVVDSKTLKPICAKLDTLAAMEPISLSYLTGGKHVMYLPDNPKTKNGNASCTIGKLAPTSDEQKNIPASIQQQRQRKRDIRESLQDIPNKTSTILSGDLSKNHFCQKHQNNNRHNSNSIVNSSPSKKSVGAPCNAASRYEKPARFSFQSTVRLLEKRRLAIKLSRNAEFKEAQRKSELEAMKRVEEDFQRKRALEKANIRHQMILFCKEDDRGDGINELFTSLPITSSQKQDQYPNDLNNNFNIYSRVEPDGAVSSPSPIYSFTERLPKNILNSKSTKTKRFEFSDCGESDIETEMANLMRTTSLVEPYLQSISLCDNLGVDFPDRRFNNMI